MTSQQKRYLSWFEVTTAVNYGKTTIKTKYSFKVFGLNKT